MSGISWLSLFPDGGHVSGHFVYELCAGCAGWRWPVLTCFLCFLYPVAKYVVLHFKRRCYLEEFAALR